MPRMMQIHMYKAHMEYVLAIFLSMIGPTTLARAVGGGGNHLIQYILKRQIMHKIDLCKLCESSTGCINLYCIKLIFITPYVTIL